MIMLIYAAIAIAFLILVIGLLQKPEALNPATPLVKNAAPHESGMDAGWIFPSVSLTPPIRVGYKKNSPSPN